MAAEMAAEARIILSHAALSLPPPHVSLDLLSSGVCVRCIFRLFGVRGAPYSSPLLTGPELRYFLMVKNGCQGAISESGHISFGVQSSEESDVDLKYCSICLGILQFPNELYLGERRSENNHSIDVFVEKIAEFIKIENHEIDGFFLELSIPPVIVANEHSIWLYMKKKYHREAWFNDKLLRNQISLKDALRLSITEPLEKKLSVKSGANSFHICLMYSNFDAALSLQNLLRKFQCSKRMRTGICERFGVAPVTGKITESHLRWFAHFKRRPANGPVSRVDVLDSTYKKGREKENVAHFADPLRGNGQVNSREQLCSKSDAAILRELDALEDHIFCELFELPPKKVSDPGRLMISCYRMPMFIEGRYLKFSRKVSQTRWIIEDERMGEASVEEIVGTHALETCRADSYKFHAAGREDIDVRMLGSGRPFLVELSNARCLPSIVDILQIAVKINSTDKKYVMVRNLKVVGNEAWNLMRVGEAEKQKQYAALVWISRPLVDEDLQIISSLNNMEISQSTPIRVLHRRSPLERKRMIHWMRIEKIVGSNQFFLLHLCTQAGTYIKEFVHGDLGRTSPNIGSILSCRAEILQLDVTDVKMDVCI